ncbi:hypothetical protein HMPREF1548_06397 [Clostridium sp. KLE 1755]|nr:hypothetical protein HMPREF1548_06397 [Clostridium sp. KLE 1755]
MGEIEGIIDISIHEVAKTSTNFRNSFRNNFRHFNPRGRKDLDAAVHLHKRRFDEISIHEVAKTSTVPEANYTAFSTFQSTRSQRPRRYSAGHMVPPEHFNPRGRKDLDNDTMSN